MTAIALLCNHKFLLNCDLQDFTLRAYNISVYYQKFTHVCLGISMAPTRQFIVKLCIGAFYENLLEKKFKFA